MLGVWGHLPNTWGSEVFSVSAESRGHTQAQCFSLQGPSRENGGDWDFLAAAQRGCRGSQARRAICRKAVAEVREAPVDLGLRSLAPPEPRAVPRGTPCRERARAGGQLLSRQETTEAGKQAALGDRLPAPSQHSATRCPSQSVPWTAPWDPGQQNLADTEARGLPGPRSEGSTLLPTLTPGPKAGPGTQEGLKRAGGLRER